MAAFGAGAGAAGGTTGVAEVVALLALVAEVAEVQFSGPRPGAVMGGVTGRYPEITVIGYLLSRRIHRH